MDADGKLRALVALREEIDGTNYDDHTPEQWAQLAALDAAIAALSAPVAGVVPDEMVERARAAWDATSNGHGLFMVGDNFDDCLRAALTAALENADEG